MDITHSSPPLSPRMGFVVDRECPAILKSVESFYSSPSRPEPLKGNSWEGLVQYPRILVVNNHVYFCTSAFTAALCNKEIVQRSCTFRCTLSSELTHQPFMFRRFTTTTAHASPPCPSFRSPSSSTDPTPGRPTAHASRQRLLIAPQRKRLCSNT
ncbi:hypothetical protein M427DRAFT_166365 [Gonapodya prolifera JEL478]|uniref:Uncharacterized protein n=1 Tax=Gonapodya prolifera (strain JEL478) TaxID=1344416 RepID=A0A139AZK8_GONPJ|nr:hypothetical protein M427DRAFT_166365 [Gonapodya prolifera JEL478]|eukprot:KXS22171.1 hypothetical protein M427DRAFT_166365 [Gonapodya prolifera JEL478]